MIMNILHEYKIFNADVVFREDCTYVNMNSARL